MLLHTLDSSNSLREGLYIFRTRTNGSFLASAGLLFQLVWQATKARGSCHHTVMSGLRFL
jgi:hypothetical protein